MADVAISRLEPSGHEPAISHSFVWCRSSNKWESCEAFEVDPNEGGWHVPASRVVRKQTQGVCLLLAHFPGASTGLSKFAAHEVSWLPLALLGSVAAIWRRVIAKIGQSAMELLIAVAVIWILIKAFAGDSTSPPSSPPSRPTPTPPPTPPSPRPVTPSTYQPRTRPSDSTVYTHVAGAPHRIGKTTPVETVFHAGQSLRAERERGNPHDSNAIKLKIGQRHVGYIPKDVNEPLARHLDYGGSLSVRVTRVNTDDRWMGVRIAVTTD